jgi:glycosyltransferase involved in cell wall biosynthesis
MSVYNGLPYLSEAVESILKQTFTDFEFIIIDDGSTDGSTETLKKYAREDERIHLITQENRGLTPSLNRGIKQARGQYLARMDADDVCPQNRLQLQMEYMDTHPECVLLGGEGLPIDEEGQRLSEDHPLFTRRNIDNLDFRHDHDDLEGRLLRGEWAFLHSAVVMRKRAVEEIGGYNPKIEDAEDLDLFLRLAEVGKIANLPVRLIKVRYHGSSVSVTSPVQQYWVKRARRAGYRRRGIPLPKDLRLPAIIRSALGKELRKRGLHQTVVRLFSRFF